MFCQALKKHKLCSSWSMYKISCAVYSLSNSYASEDSACVCARHMHMFMFAIKSHISSTSLRISNSFQHSPSTCVAWLEIQNLKALRIPSSGCHERVAVSCYSYQWIAHLQSTYYQKRSKAFKSDLSLRIDGTSNSYSAHQAQICINALQCIQYCHIVRLCNILQLSRAMNVHHCAVQLLFSHANARRCWGYGS